jgi:hypothetical protein
VSILPVPPDPNDDDEATDAPPPDPNDDPTHPLHGLAVEYFETADPTRRGFVPILAVAFDERDVGFLEAATRFADEPSEDARDWGIWSFHPSFTNALGEE